MKERTPPSATAKASKVDVSFEQWLVSAAVPTSLVLTLAQGVNCAASAVVLVELPQLASQLMFMFTLGFFLYGLQSLYHVVFRSHPSPDDALLRQVLRQLMDALLPVAGVFWCFHVCMLDPETAATELAALARISRVRAISNAAFGVVHVNLPSAFPRHRDMGTAAFFAISFAGFAGYWWHTGDAHTAFVLGWAPMVGSFSAAAIASLVFERPLLTRLSMLTR